MENLAARIGRQEGIGGGLDVLRNASRSELPGPADQLVVEVGRAGIGRDVARGDRRLALGDSDHGEADVAAVRAGGRLCPRRRCGSGLGRHDTFGLPGGVVRIARVLRAHPGLKRVGGIEVVADD